MRGRGTVAGGWLVVLALVAAGCGDDDPAGSKPGEWTGQSTPDSVLVSFQAAWRARDIAGYSRLLAEDFRSALSKSLYFCFSIRWLMVFDDMLSIMD